MNEINVNLQFSIENNKKIVEKLFSLPDKFKPKHYGYSDLNCKKKILNASSLLDSLDENCSMPFLKNCHCDYFIFKRTLTIVECFVTIKKDRSMAYEFLERMVDLKPVFGYACVSEEFIAKNRVEIRYGGSVYEGWVGRDLNKYVPGLYWLTLISDKMIELHNIDIDIVKNVSLSYSYLEEGQHLFKFYHEPEDWRSDNKILELYHKFPKIFNIVPVMNAVKNIKNHREFSKAISNYL